MTDRRLRHLANVYARLVAAPDPTGEERLVCDLLERLLVDELDARRGGLSCEEALFERKGLLNVCPARAPT